MIPPVTMSHADLCAVAVKWLKRANSAGGPGCHVAVSECRSGWSGEVPDAIGFRASGFEDGSVVIECKTSRSDFLADQKKPHRSSGGLGNWRYFMAPEGLIMPDELPPGWGLLAVNSRGHVKAVAGPAVHFRGRYDVLREQIEQFRHVADRDREQFILVKLLWRVGDAEEMNRKIKSVYAERSRLTDLVSRQVKDLRDLRDEIRRLKREVAAL